MPDATYETADDIATLAAQHDQLTTIQTPAYSEIRWEHHTEFLVATRALRADIPRNTAGEPVNDLDLDLAKAASPNFARLSTAIEKAALASGNRRFR